MPCAFAAAGTAIKATTVLERVADHATNIAEHIYYVETGEMRQLGREEHGHGLLVDHLVVDHHNAENTGRDADVPVASTNGAASPAAAETFLNGFANPSADRPGDGA